MNLEVRRQIVHISGVFFIIFAQFIPRIYSIAIFSSIAIFFFVYSRYVEKVKKNENIFHKIERRFRDFVFKFERPEAKKPFEGAFYFYAGFAFAFILFPIDIASASAVILSVGDSLSTLVGKYYGRHKICKKTIEGLLAFFITSFFSSIFFVNPWLAFSGSVVGAFVELVSKIDDNLMIPVVSGFVMLLLKLL